MQKTNSILGPNDLTLCHADGSVYAGGYEISSILQSPMTTIVNQSKGGGNKVSDIFRNLAVPSGLLCLQGSKCAGLPRGENKGVVDHKVYNRLMELASIKGARKRNKTRGRKSSTTKGTRRKN